MEERVNKWCQTKQIKRVHRPIKVISSVFASTYVRKSDQLRYLDPENQFLCHLSKTMPQ